MPDYFPPAGFYFKVIFNNPSGGLFTETSFKEVSGLSVDTAPEEITEGGLLSFHHRLPTTPRYSNLVLKRGLLKDSKLRDWVNKALRQFEFSPLFANIELLDQFSKPGANPTALMTWKVYNVRPVKWELSTFDSLSNEVVIETLELAFDYFET